MMAEEWENAKRRLIFYEEEPDSQLRARTPDGAVPSYQMLVNAVFARALRLIMEKLEAS